ncbi:hypothetical protein [Methanobacterium aggregans]|uniref:hypothetical protein n=1 Tax=Methanobacterium aggregans TaxID=1615586 RepID=UPI001AE3E342|nr:hypothetical protein [Methanobacterium aggregans]MBP2046952.1 hypothetical protein [Methanobacterium aggregans]
MELNHYELQELQEYLILLYKFVSQRNMLKEFYYRGIEFNESLRCDLDIVGDLTESEDSEDILKNSIIEVEELKTGETFKKGDFQDKFNEIILRSKVNLSFIEKVDWDQFLSLIVKF